MVRCDRRRLRVLVRENVIFFVVSTLYEIDDYDDDDGDKRVHTPPLILNYHYF